MIGVTTMVFGIVLAGVAGQAVQPVEASRPQAGVRLAYQFTSGEILGMEVRESSRMLVVKGAARQEQSNQTTTHSHYRVVKVDEDGSATLRYQIDRTQMQARFDDNPPVEFDSDTKKTPAAFSEIRKSIGEEIVEFQVDPTGTLSGTRSLQAVRNDAKPGDATKTAQAASEAFPELPSEPVQIGEEWTRIRTMRVNVGEGLRSRLTQEVKILLTFELAEVADGVATIRYRSAPLQSINEPTIQLQVAPQNATGSIRFDIAAGRILERTKTVDNLTLGWQGADSSLKTHMTRTERALPPSGREVSSRD